MLATLRTLIRGLLQRRRVARELDEELRFHVERETQSNINAGMSPTEAHRVALRELGGVEQTKEAVRDVRTISLDSLWQDVRLAIRVLAKHRLSTSLTLLMLGMGLGVNTAVFTAANAWLVSPYPYPQPDRLVMLEARHIKGSVGAHYRDFLDWRERNRVFEEIAIFFSVSRMLTGGSEPQRVSCQVTTASAIRVLGISPVVGRFFSEQEDAPGGPFIALVTHSAWKRRFDGRSDIVGTIATLDGRAYTVIGVMPDRAALPQRTPPEFWVPLRANPSAAHGGQQYYELMARLKPGITLEQARANMADVAAVLEREDPASNAGWRVVVTPAQESIRARTAGTLTLFFTIAACLLLLVAANVAGVSLVRSASRAKELAIRTALGAGRWRLIRQLLIESLLLGMLGGGLALLIGDWVLRVAGAVLPNRGLEALPSLEWPVLLFTAATAMLTGLLFGLWPASRVASVDLGGVLKSGGVRSEGKSRTRLLSGLVVVEIALALALLSSGGLLTKDLAALLRVDTGLQPEGVVTFLLRPAPGRYTSDEAKAALTSQVLEQLRAIPGVEAAAAAGQLPMGGAKTGVRFDVETPSSDVTAPSARGILNASSPGYFAVLGIPLLEGRDFEAHDRLGTEPVAIVSERLARRHITDRTVLGERVKMYGRSYRIVGVVGSVRHDGPGYEPDPEIYLPLAQSPSLPTSFAVRGTADLTLFRTEIRNRIAEVDPGLAVDRLQTMNQVIHDSLSQPRLSAQVLAGFALFGLALALTGLYGSVAYSTEQRTREFAIRMSLGATPGEVQRLVLRRGIRLAAVGLICGVPLAFGVSHMMRSALVMTSPRDPVVFAVVSALLMMAPLAATYIPARRATRVAPLVALRSE